MRGPRRTVCQRSVLAGALLSALVAPAAEAQVLLWEYRDIQVVKGFDTHPKGSVFIADKTGSRVVEVAPTFPSGGRIVREVGGLNWPDRVTWFAPGNLLVSNTRDNDV